MLARAMVSLVALTDEAVTSTEAAATPAPLSAVPPRWASAEDSTSLTAMAAPNDRLLGPHGSQSETTLKSLLFVAATRIVAAWISAPPATSACDVETARP